MKELIKKHLKNLFEDTFHVSVNKIIFSKNKHNPDDIFGNVYYGDNKKLNYKFMTTLKNEHTFTTVLAIPPDDDLYHSDYFSSLIKKNFLYNKVRNSYNLNHKYKQYRLDEADSSIIVRQTVKKDQASVTHDFKLHIFSLHGVDRKSAISGQIDTNLIIEWNDSSLISVCDEYLVPNMHYPNKPRLLNFKGYGKQEIQHSEESYNFILDIIHRNFIYFIAINELGILPIDDISIEDVYKTAYSELNSRFVADNLVRDMVLI